MANMHTIEIEGDALVLVFPPQQNAHVIKRNVTLANQRSAEIARYMREVWLPEHLARLRAERRANA